MLGFFCSEVHITDLLYLVLALSYKELDSLYSQELRILGSIGKFNVTQISAKLLFKRVFSSEDIKLTEYQVMPHILRNNF
jgi:hypothetical protein